MSVTSLKELDTNHKVVQVRHMIGVGSPVGDTVLASDTNYPVGSTYIDSATGLKWRKTAAETWTTRDMVTVVSDGAPAEAVYTDATTYPVDKTIVYDKTNGVTFLRVDDDGDSADFVKVGEAN